MSEISLATVLKEWGRIGCIGFGGPPAHIALLRKLGCEFGQGYLFGRPSSEPAMSVNRTSVPLPIFTASLRTASKELLNIQANG